MLLQTALPVRWSWRRKTGIEKDKKARSSVSFPRLTTCRPTAEKKTSGNPRHLLFYRLAIFSFMTTLGADQLQRRGFRVLMFFTTWSWWLLSCYFLLGMLASARRVHSDGRERRAKGRGNGSSSSSNGSSAVTAKPSKTTATTTPLLDAAAVALLHVALPSSLLVVAVTWLVLVPMLMSSGEKNRVAFTRAMFFNFASYSQHGFNALFALGDVFLNQMPFLPHVSGALLSLYSSVFGVWALSLGRVGIWLYPFLNAHKPWAAVAYSGLFVSNWLFFFVAWGSFKLRDRLAASFCGGGGGNGRSSAKKRVSSNGKKYA